MLVNNAGITKDGLLMRMKKEDFEDVIDINLVGTFNITRNVIPYMIKARSGKIINISSVVGISGNAGQTNYYFDCQQMAVTNLPQFDYSRIHAPNDGYVWAFDVWLTPFKPYTFALFQHNSNTYFKWYGGGNLIQPSFVDGGSLPGDEPILSGDDTFIRVFFLKQLIGNPYNPVTLKLYRLLWIIR